jgi:hypothetical protein
MITLGFAHVNAKESKTQELQKLPDASYSLNGVIDEKKSPPFAGSFGRYTVEMVPSKNTEHKYFKVAGVGILINSSVLHAKRIGSNDKIIYAVPKDAPISNGSVLSAYCIGHSQVPYEGPERKDIDRSAAVMEFYVLER